MGKSPAFQFYPNDWLGSTKVAMMTPEEEGGYIRLLCYCWGQDDCSLPSDDAGLAKLSRLTDRWPICKDNILKCFEEKNGRIYNKRLQKERKKQSEFSKKQASNGSKGGRPKKGLGLSGLTQNEPKKSSSSSSSSSTSYKEVEEEKMPINNDSFFEMFRRVAGPHISNSELQLEVAKFKNKYPNNHPNKSGALINTWVANIGKENINPLPKNHFV